MPRPNPFNQWGGESLFWRCFILKETFGDGVCVDDDGNDDEAE